MVAKWHNNFQTFSDCILTILFRVFECLEIYLFNVIILLESGKYAAYLELLTICETKNSNIISTISTQYNIRILIFNENCLHHGQF